MQGKVLHVAHRGGAREGLENTIPAFKNALKVGSNMLEMDVCVTKDNVLVVSHDDNLLRLCRQDVCIRDLNYKELPRHQDKVPIHFSKDLEYDTTTLENPYFPTLEEVFKELPGTLMNIELKTSSPDAIKSMAEMIKKYKREDLTIWGCKFLKDSNMVQATMPEAITFFSAERIMRTYGLYITGLLPFFPIREDSIQVPKLSHDYFSWKMATEGGLKTKAFFSAVKFINWISTPLFWHLEKRGIIVIYWVMNTEHDYELCVKQNVNGIMTDLPTSLKNYLVKEGKYIHNKND